MQKFEMEESLYPLSRGPATGSSRGSLLFRILLDAGNAPFAINPSQIGNDDEDEDDSWGESRPPTDARFPSSSLYVLRAGMFSDFLLCL
jgi:hypothetical protein